MQGHNDHIRQYVRWHRLPKNSFKRWEREVFDLKTFFDERSRAEAPRRLVANGPSFRVPDIDLSLQPVVGIEPDGKSDDHLFLALRAGNTLIAKAYVTYSPCYPSGQIDLIWGPQGSHFFVVRLIEGGHEQFTAYDVNNGQSLREETWHSGKRDPLRSHSEDVGAGPKSQSQSQR